MIFNHFLFKCNHPALNIDFYLFGSCHTMQYDEFPPYSRQLLESADLIFHEGVNGVVFIDPDWKPKVSYLQPNDTNAWCVDRMNDEEKQILQKILNAYFINVKRKLYAPKLTDVEPWVVIQLIANFDYFARGNEIDHTLNYKRSIKNKKTVYLDQEHLSKELKEYLINQNQTRKINSFYTLDPSTKATINSFFTTGSTEGLEITDNSDPCYPSHENISNLILEYNDICRDYPHMTIQRDQRWIEILHTYFKKIIQTKSSRKKDVVLVCGAGHITSLIPRLICEGFKVDKVFQEKENHLHLIPISKQEKGLFFKYELEQTTFNNLRTQIIAKDNKLTWIEEMVSLTNWNEWRENYRNTNKITKGYEPGALVIRARPNFYQK